MKLSTLSLIAISIFICFASISYHNTQTETLVATVKRQYRTYMQNACESAINTADFTKQTLFGTEADREKVINTFFSTLAGSFNMEGAGADELRQYVPVIILLDYDGFYVWDNNLQEAELTRFVSWCEAVDKYVVRYYLDGYIKVTDTADASGVIYHGKREEVSNFINDDKLSYLQDNEALEFRKNCVITAEIKRAIESFVNSNRFNEFNVQYNVELSAIEDEDWGRIIKSPTILAFLQGKQVKEINNNIVLNIYSFSGTEIVGAYHYFIDESNKYHCLEEMLDSKEVLNVGGNYYYNGVKVEKIYSSIEECAKLGAYPA